MKSLFEEFGGTYTLGKDGMYYPNLMIEETDQRYDFVQDNLSSVGIRAFINSSF